MTPIVLLLLALRPAVALEGEGGLRSADGGRRLKKDKNASTVNKAAAEYPRELCRWTGCVKGGCERGEIELDSEGCGFLKPNNEYCCLPTPEPTRSPTPSPTEFVMPDNCRWTGCRRGGCEGDEVEVDKQGCGLMRYNNELCCAPTPEPTPPPTGGPSTVAPTGKPTGSPTSKPTDEPTTKPTPSPTGKPTAMSTGKPTALSVVQPSGLTVAQPPVRAVVEPPVRAVVDPPVRTVVEPPLATLEFPTPTPPPLKGLETHALPIDHPHGKKSKKSKKLTKKSKLKGELKNKVDKVHPKEPSKKSKA